VLVPEATVNEHDFPETAEDEVGLSGELVVMKAESETETMSDSSNGHLWFHSLAANGAHVARAASGRNVIHTSDFGVESDAQQIPCLQGALDGLDHSPNFRRNQSRITF
jgi:hypothetical protein